MTEATGTFPAPDHDHADCMVEALARAEALCAAQDCRLTPKRRAVLQVLLADHTPMGAYEIMERLDWTGRRPAPVIVYRALEFLESLGLVHRIESLNAYFACSNPGDRHTAQFLICKTCRRVAEATNKKVGKAVAQLSESSGFALAAPMVEIQGTCPNCTEKDQ